MIISRHISYANTSNKNHCVISPLHYKANQWQTCVSYFVSNNILTKNKVKINVYDYDLLFSEENVSSI